MGLCKDCDNYGLFSQRCNVQGWPKQPDDTCPAFFSADNTIEIPEHVVFTKGMVGICESLLKVKLQIHQEQLLTGHEKRNIVVWPRVTGKSYMAAVMALFDAFTTNGDKIVIVSPNKNMTARIFSTMRYIITTAGLGHEVKRDVTAPYYELGFVNRSRIRGFHLAANGVGFKGQDADHIIIDNVEFIPFKGMTSCIMPVLMTTPDTQLTAFTSDIFAMTPDMQKMFSHFKEFKI